MINVYGEVKKKMHALLEVYALIPCGSQSGKTKLVNMAAAYGAESTKLE